MNPISNRSGHARGESSRASMDDAAAADTADIAAALEPNWIIEIVHENDQNHIPVQNVERIMKRALPHVAPAPPPHHHPVPAQVPKIERDAKALVQECVSEFIGFVTSDAKLFMEANGRKTVTGPDVVLALEDLWFKPYADLVRAMQWPGGAPGDPVPGKKRNRPPPPLESAQQQLPASALKRWRGGRAPDSTACGSGPESEERQQKETIEKFQRVLTIKDVYLACQQRQQPAPKSSRARAYILSPTAQHSLSSPPSLQSIPNGKASTRSVKEQTQPAPIKSQQKEYARKCNATPTDPRICYVTPTDPRTCNATPTDPRVYSVTPTDPRICNVVPADRSNVQAPTTSQQQKVFVENHYESCDGMMPTLFFEESISRPELKSVLNSPKMGKFPTPDVLTRHVAVRSMDPFGIDIMSQYGLDLDSFSCNTSVAMDVAAFSQLTDNAQAPVMKCSQSRKIETSTANKQRAVRMRNSHKTRKMSEISGY